MRNKYKLNRNEYDMFCKELLRQPKWTSYMFVWLIFQRVREFKRFYNSKLEGNIFNQLEKDNFIKPDKKSKECGFYTYYYILKDNIQFYLDYGIKKE